MKKRFSSILAFLIAAIMLFSVIGCNPETDPPEVSTESTTESVPEQTTESETTGTADCTHTYAETVEVPAKALKEGTKRLTCSNCGDSYTEVIPATNTLKILAIGNSFSVDAMQYLWNVAKDGGVETVILGNLYIGGCALSTHASNIKSASKAYTYYKNTAGTWTQTSSKSVQDGLADEEWDIITVQQASGSSGLATTYNDLDYILGFLAENKPNADVYWHMTWAYQQNSTHKDFPNYGSDQMKMYNGILNAVDTKVKTQESICGIIPSGTAIQNLRTSYIGDTITRDGYHMSYDFGRYTLALTWYAYFTGGDVANVDWLPVDYSAVIKPHLPAIREAVNAALEKPFEITEVKAENPITVNPTTDEERIASLGYNINDFVELDWFLEVNAYYNSNVKIGIYNAQTSTASNVPNFIASKLLRKEDLPVGSIIIVDNGYQYRPEGWIDENTTNNSSTRPGNVTATVLEVTEAWWGNFTIRAFNLSATVTRKMVEDDIPHLRIYVPKSDSPVKADTPTDEERIASLGYNINDYVELDWFLEVNAYYHSGKTIEIYNAQTSTATNLPNFIASKLLKKEDLPVGSIIIVDSGYQYRPEGWIDENTTNSTRPGNVSETVVEVTEAWWGNFTIRAFNLSAIATRAMVEDDIPHLRIYVPKSANPVPVNP